MEGFTDLEKNHIYFLLNGQLQKRVYGMLSFLKTCTYVDDTWRVWKSTPQGQASRDNAYSPPRSCVSLWSHFTYAY